MGCTQKWDVCGMGCTRDGMYAGWDENNSTFSETLGLLLMLGRF